MFVVTAAAGGKQAGCLIGFATQASIQPPRFLACLSTQNQTYAVAARARHLVVHVVGDEHRELAALFGGETGDDVDKFARVRWRPGPGGAPVLEDCDQWFAGRVLERFAFGDHVGFLLAPVDAHAEGGAAGDDQLTFQATKDIDPGHPA
jgi:flavin reductase (DIM6/NTAB) family NADH-FMN oxidoreductase RutF